MNGWCEYELRDLHDEEKRAEICGIAPNDVRQNVMGIVLSHSLGESQKQANIVYKRGNGLNRKGTGFVHADQGTLGVGNLIFRFVCRISSKFNSR